MNVALPTNHYLTNCNKSKSSQVKVTLRLTVSQPVSLGVKPHLGLMTRYLLLFDSYGLVFCGAPSLTRGQVCLLYMLLALASAVFHGSESLGTRDHILLSQIWDFPFRRLLWLAGSRWRYSTPPPHGLNCNNQLALLIKYQHGPRRKHRTSVAVQLFLSDRMTHSIIACAAISMDCAENTIPLLLFIGHCLVTVAAVTPQFLLWVHMPQYFHLPSSMLHAHLIMHPNN
jgi:hypothetical protein